MKNASFQRVANIRQQDQAQRDEHVQHDAKSARWESRRLVNHRIAGVVAQRVSRDVDQ